MVYFRVALQKCQSTEWEWESTTLNSLESVLRVRQQYNGVPAEQLRVFVASAAEYMDILLVRENLGLASNSRTVDQLLHDRQWIAVPRVRRFEAALGWSKNEDTSQSQTTPEQESGGHDVENSQSQATPEEEAGEHDAENAQSQDTADHEQGAGDHDEPYVFELPKFMPHALALVELMAKVRSGKIAS